MGLCEGVSLCGEVVSCFGQYGVRGDGSYVWCSKVVV